MSAQLHPEALLEQRVRGTLSRTDARTLNRHLRACATCRLELRIRADADAELSSWAPEPAALERAIEGARRAATDRTRRGSTQGSAWVRSLGTAGGLLVGAAVGAAMLLGVLGLALLRATPPAADAGLERPLAVDRARSGQSRLEAVEPGAETAGHGTARAGVAAPPALGTSQPGVAPEVRDDAPSVIRDADPPPPEGARAAKAPAESARNNAAKAGRRDSKPDAGAEPKANVADASAGPETTSKADATTTAAQLFAKATAARRRGQIDEALELLGEASRIAPRSRAGLTALVAAARIQLESKGDARRALALYRLYLRRAPRGTLREEAKAGVARAKEHLEGRPGGSPQ